VPTAISKMKAELMKKFRLLIRQGHRGA